MDDTMDAATGAILAREVERAHAPGHDPSGACANCGAVLTGPYCATCGQHGHVHRTAGALLHDLLHGVFHFEGKLWATLPLLAWRPGELTRRYVRGERARFVSPVALFLFSVFLLFAVMSNLPGRSFGQGVIDGFTDSRGADVGGARARLADEVRKADAAVADAARRLTAARAATPPDGARVAAAEARLATARGGQRELQLALSLLPGRDAAGARTPLQEKRSWFATRYQAAKQDPKLLLYKIKTSAYKWSWALIPLSLPFIWLLFPLRRGVGMYDHAVFATYSLSFMSLLVIVLAALAATGVPSVPLARAFPVIAIAHLFLQLKGAYSLGWAGAAWRTAWMLLFILFIVPMFGFLLLALGIAD